MNAQNKITDISAIEAGIFSSESDISEAWHDAIEGDAEYVITAYYDHSQQEAETEDPDAPCEWIDAPQLIGAVVDCGNEKKTYSRLTVIVLLGADAVRQIEAVQCEAVNRPY